MQFIATFFGERHADESTTVFGHEIDSFRRNFLGSHRQIAFVFAILIIYEHNHSPVADFRDGFLNGAKGRSNGGSHDQSSSLNVCNRTNITPLCRAGKHSRPSVLMPYEHGAYPKLETKIVKRRVRLPGSK